MKLFFTVPSAGYAGLCEANGKTPLERTNQTEVRYGLSLLGDRQWDKIIVCKESGFKEICNAFGAKNYDPDKVEEVEEKALPPADFSHVIIVNVCPRKGDKVDCDGVIMTTWIPAAA